MSRRFGCEGTFLGVIQILACRFEQASLLLSRCRPIVALAHNVVQPDAARGTFMILSRRSVVLGLGLTTLPAQVWSTPLRPTPQETLGPFYPVKHMNEHDLDLAHVSGRPERAKGQLIEVIGRVLRRDGSPVSGASIDVWQANSVGRYANVGDDNHAPLDPNFQGFARIRAGRDGTFRIVSIKPGAYPDPSGAPRTPHIHFDITGNDSRVVTQMYFPSEPLNEVDAIRSTMALRHNDPALLTARLISPSSSGMLTFAWDIVLRDPV